MLMVDDNMYKLAKMQESLLKVGDGDKKYHLECYIKTITQIDKKTYDELVELMKDADKYNQTLETELSYLEKVKVAYEEMVELQMKFKGICERYGGEDLELSDLSQLNIEYVEDRINVINGYLINVKNIEENKKKLGLLNEQLVVEERKRELLSKKILVLDKKLKDSFIGISLKQVVFGKLESFDIKIEYEKLGYDLTDLINNDDVLNTKIKTIKAQLDELNEKYEIAKVCHNNLFNVSSKNVMTEIEKEFYIVKYRYVMLRILELLGQQTNDYELSKNKRNEFINLINDRSLCLEKLGIRNPLNILHLVDMEGQMNDINVLDENIENINGLRQEISDITLKTEEMISQNDDYLMSLNDTKEMINSGIGLNDFDITTFDDIVAEEVLEEKIILNNQVTKVRNIPSNFRLNIAKQKAKGVIERICRISIKSAVVSKTKEVYTPELVIVPKEQISKSEELVIDTLDEVKESTVDIPDNIEVLEPIYITPILDIEPKDEHENNKTVEADAPVISVTEEVEEKTEVAELTVDIDDSIIEETNSGYSSDEETPTVVYDDIFETTTPFAEPILFSDKSDSEVSEVSQLNDSFAQEESIFMPEMDLSLPVNDIVDSESIVDENSMPDAFWVTESVTPKPPEEEKVELSFEEQISALLAESNNESVSKRR